MQEREVENERLRLAEKSTFIPQNWFDYIDVHNRGLLSSSDIIGFMRA